MLYKWGAQKLFKKPQHHPNTEQHVIIQSPLAKQSSPLGPASSLETARLLGAMFSGQLWGGFPCCEAAQAIKQPSKPHLGVLCNPEPQPVPGKHCHSPKMDTDRRIQNKKGDHKSKGSDSPLKKSGFVLIIHVQRWFDCGEFTFIHQASRGQRVPMKEVPTCKRSKKDGLNRLSGLHSLPGLKEKKCGLSSKHHVFSNMSILGSHEKNTGVPQCKGTLNI